MNDEPIATIAAVNEHRAAGAAPGRRHRHPRRSAGRSRARGPDRFRTPLNVVAASVPAAVLYLFYVRHYSLNVPFSDDWKKTQFVVTAIHGRVDLGAMWRQYAEARLFVPELVFVWVGLLDDFNLRTIVTVSAVVADRELRAAPRALPPLPRAAPHALVDPVGRASSGSAWPIPATRSGRSSSRGIWSCCSSR